MRASSNRPRAGIPDRCRRSIQHIANSGDRLVRRDVGLPIPAGDEKSTLDGIRIRNVPLPAVLLAFADGAGWIAIAMPPAGGRSRDAGASRFRGPNHIVRLGSGASHYPFLHPAGARGHDKRLTAGCVCRWNVRLTKGQHARKVGAGEANLAEAHQFAEWTFVEGPLLAQGRHSANRRCLPVSEVAFCTTSSIPQQKMGKCQPRLSIMVFAT
jgi:hypothetical protein